MSSLSLPYPPSPLPSPPTDGITSLTFSPNLSGPELLLSSSWDATVRLHGPPKLPNGASNEDCDSAWDLNNNNYVAIGSLQSANNPSPILCACFPSLSSTTTSRPPMTAYGGCLSGLVTMYDFANSRVVDIGRHDKSVSCIASSSRIGSVEQVGEGGHGDDFSVNGGYPLDGCIATGGWDGRLKLWDVRTNTNGTAGSSFDVALPSKVFAMSFVEYRIVAGVAGRVILSYDVR
jgi:WD40 repeat protein